MAYRVGIHSYTFWKSLSQHHPHAVRVTGWRARSKGGESCLTEFQGLPPKEMTDQQMRVGGRVNAQVGWWASLSSVLFFS